MGTIGKFNDCTDIITVIPDVEQQGLNQFAAIHSVHLPKLVVGHGDGINFKYHGPVVGSGDENILTKGQEVVQ